MTNVIYDNGTNKWHGGLWETYAGADLDALKAEEHAQGLTRVPQYVNKIFGFKLGGPLVHNKLFIFGSSQWNRFFGAFTGSQMLIPTANGLTALQSIQLQQSERTDSLELPGRSCGTAGFGYIAGDASQRWHARRLCG